MRVAVLGGGMQGCCVALILAQRGVKVTLFERHDALLMGASSNNEGKIHLGYVYAGDPTLATARRMIAGALAFAPFVDRILESRAAFNLSTPFFYLVHRASQKPAADYAGYLARVHDELRSAAQVRTRAYFGLDLFAPRRCSRSEVAGFDEAEVSAAFATPEIAVDPAPLCAAIRARVAAEPNIALRLGRTVLDVVDTDAGFAVVTDPGDGVESFDHVVNALWDGRLALDARRNLTPKRAWLHRVKYGFRFSASAVTRSVTLVLGPFGDIVAYADGTRYLSWYPACLRATSAALTPPHQALTPQDIDAMVNDSLRALGAVMPELRDVDCRGLAPIGGTIVAWGKTGIDDPASELHARHDIGVTSVGRYHSVDPGKFTMIPHFALLCADRIRPESP